MRSCEVVRGFFVLGSTVSFPMSVANFVSNLYISFASLSEK